MTNEQIKDIIIAMIEKGYMNATSYDETINRIIKVYTELSSKC